jgi:hypothetical protein
MAPFSGLLGLYHYLAKGEEAFFLCMLFTLLYCLSAAFWISVLSSGLDSARFWKGHRKGEGHLQDWVNIGTYTVKA